MKKNNFQRHLIAPQAAVIDALKALNGLPGGKMTLFVTDSSGVLKGTITDGDIRRALLSGIDTGMSVDKAMNTNFLAAGSEKEIIPATLKARKLSISLLPVLEDGKLKDIIDLGEQGLSLPLDAVLMAGGRGERLRPLTDSRPKPLLEVGGKAVIDYNVEALERAGVKNIFITLNYLSDLIISHFDNRDNLAEIGYVKEPCRLGTFGSISLIEGLHNEDILVMNSDLLTDVDFEALFIYHKEARNDMTVCTVPYVVSVPYAIMEMKEGRVSALREKPTFNYLANAGVYLLRRELIGKMKKGEYLDAPDFIDRVIREGGKVGSFTIEGRWIDIGSPEDYRYANSIITRKDG